MYFIPKKKSDVKSAKQTYYIGSDRDVDEYNRRGKLQSTVTPVGDGDDIIDFDGVAGVYPDSLALDSVYDTSYAKLPSSKFYADEEDETDYRYSNMLDRWYGVYDPWFYGPGYYGRHFYWHSPYYYSHYYGIYDPWYFDTFGLWGSYGYYGPWYTGWYDPWFNPWYGGYWGWHNHYYWGGGYVGGLHGTTVNHRPSRGGEIAKGGYTGSGGRSTGRRNTYNDIAKRSAVKEARTRQVNSSNGRTAGQRYNSTTESRSYTPSTYSGSRSSGSSFSGGGSRGGGFSGGGGGSRSGGSSGGGSHGGRR